MNYFFSFSRVNLLGKVRVIKQTAIFVLIFSSGCATEVTKMQDALDLQPSELALYSPLNRGDFSGPSIQTIDINGKPFQGGPYFGMKPGNVSVRVTFANFDDGVIAALGLGSLKIRNFVGWYDLRFIAKPGKLYVPIFNYNLPDLQRLSEMCIAELPAGASISESRTPQNYLVCAKPTIPPTSDNIKLCSEMQFVPGTSSISYVYHEGCGEIKRISESVVKESSKK